MNALLAAGDEENARPILGSIEGIEDYGGSGSRAASGFITEVGLETITRVAAAAASGGGEGGGGITIPPGFELPPIGGIFG